MIRPITNLHSYKNHLNYKQHNYNLTKNMQSEFKQNNISSAYNNIFFTGKTFSNKLTNIPLLIQKSTEKDLEKIHKIDLIEFGYLDNIPKDFTKYKQETKQLKTLSILDKDGTFFGYLQLKHLDKETLYINSLVVEEKFRKTKTFYNILNNVKKYILNEVKTNNYKKISLHVDTNKTTLIKLYKKMGFKITNIQNNFFANGTNGYYMEKKL